MSLVLDLHPSINGHLPYPHDLDRPLYEDTTDKYVNTTLIIIIVPLMLSSLFQLLVVRPGCLHGEFVYLLFLQTHRETDRFLPDSGVHLVQSTLHFHGVVFTSHLKNKVGHILTKPAALRIILNVDGTPIPSRSHAHP